MDKSQEPQTIEELPLRSKYEGLLWMILAILLIAVAALLLQRNWSKLSTAIGIPAPLNFDQVMNSKGLHDVTLDNGRAYDISYEASFKREFKGLVRHASDIHEAAFAILTEDILVTSGDFANPDLVETGVSNHHFTWMSKTNANPNGAINLLHTVPLNEEVNQALKSIQSGDTVIITGYDILRINGYDPKGVYIGYWEDAGCNTTLVTKVEILN